MHCKESDLVGLSDQRFVEAGMSRHVYEFTEMVGKEEGDMLYCI
jgi:hypothetical protein